MPILVAIIFLSDTAMVFTIPIIIGAIGVTVWEILKWYFTFLEIKENHLLVKRGILFIDTRDTQYKMVQNIDISAGPLMRIIGLYRLDIWTSSSKIYIEKGSGGSCADEFVYLGKEDADWLKIFILDKNKKTEI